jgi:hypothetical protein
MRGLLPVHRLVGNPDELLGVTLVVGECDTSTHADRCTGSLFKRTTQFRLDAVPNSLDVVRGRIDEQRSELITAEAAHHVWRVHTSYQPPSDVDEDALTNVVTEPIIDGFEAVKVKEEECASRAPVEFIA